MPQFITIKKCYGFIRTQILAGWIIALAVTPFAAGWGGSAAALAAGGRCVVVLDPGHGGNDTGVLGLRGVAEKRICLELAKKIERVLGETCRVHLTRTGDYDMSVVQRTSIANHRDADLFISLHAGGGFRRTENRWTLYYYEPPPVVNNSDRPENRADGPLPAWRRVQQRHVQNSKSLAERLQKRLQENVRPAIVDVQGAPLAVLMGADMPAVMIELGYLTHPPAAERLSESAYQDKLAESVARAVSDFHKVQSIGN